MNIEFNLMLFVSRSSLTSLCGNITVHLAPIKHYTFIRTCLAESAIRNFLLMTCNVTSRPSAPVDLENFTGDVYLKIFTGMGFFSPGYNTKDIF